jgi:Ca-activated chloride channel homolog
MNRRRLLAAVSVCMLAVVSVCLSVVMAREAWSPVRADGERLPSLHSFSQKQVLSARADLVVVHALVEDDGDPIAGLTEKNFEVYEDNARQTLSLFGSQDEPVTAGLLIDNSSSMAPNRDRVITAGLHFARMSNPRDELFVLHFNDDVTFGLRSETAFTSHLVTLQQALLRMKGLGKTALFDAISSGLDHLRTATQQTRVLILVSDGGDNASRRTLREILDRVRRTDVMIFSVAVIDQYNPDAKPGVLKELANATGGLVWRPRHVDDVHTAFDEIAKDIRSGYSLGYVSTNQQNGAYRKIRVVARDARGRKLSVRARAGYIASSVDGGH